MYHMILTLEMFRITVIYALKCATLHANVESDSLCYQSMIKWQDFLGIYCNGACDYMEGELFVCNTTIRPVMAYAMCQLSKSSAVS